MRATAYLEIEFVAGTDIKSAAQEALRLACLLDIHIRFNFNGIRCHMDNKSSVEWLVLHYEKSSSHKEEFMKSAFGWIDPEER